MLSRTSLLSALLAGNIAVSARPQGPSEGGPPTGGNGGPPFSGSPGSWSGTGNWGTSPAYPLFQYPLPIPQIAKPAQVEVVDGQKMEYYELTVEEYEHHVYPELGPARLVAYNGSSPGPTFMIERGTQTVIRVVNKAPGNTSAHLHGSATHAVWDGWASDVIPQGQYKDYYYPNIQAQPLWYHDHVEAMTSQDVYYGQAGVYIVYDPAEDSLGLPSGVYDVPLALSDKTYQSDGGLAAPDTQNSFFGDTIQVNEQPWPFFQVEPRKYRLRFFEMSLSRPYDLYFVDDNGNTVDFQVIGSDGGLLSSPVNTSDLTISMGERYEVIFDFASYKGENITLMNKMDPISVDNYENTDKVMRFVVGDKVNDDSNNGPVPSTLNQINWPEKKTTVDYTFEFQHGGDNLWTINGVDFSDVNNRILARPEQGTVELWQLNYASGPGVHPIHMHLVHFQVVSRTGGSRGVLPYEANGLKDVVLLEPGESVQALAYYGPWFGLYQFHCHNLVHEDYMMLAAFNNTLVESLGYNATDEFSDPMNPKFAPREYDEAEFDASYIKSMLSSFRSLNAYQLPSTAAASTS